MNDAIAGSEQKIGKSSAGSKFRDLGAIMLDGIFGSNPSFRLILGTCPLLAVTTSVMNGLGMGISATAVLICSNIVISLIRNYIPDSVRIPAYITVIAGFVTITDLILHAYAPELYSALGIFIPLIVVNCIILARAEMFANKNGIIRSIADGLGMGMGFTGALLLIGSVRELLGSGTWMGVDVTRRLFAPASLLLLPPGGFMAYGAVLAVINKITKKKTPVMSCDGCAQKCGLVSSAGDAVGGAGDAVGSASKAAGSADRTISSVSGGISGAVGGGNDAEGNA